jgi:hypothetical protein
MGAATELRSPHRRDAPAYLSTVEDLITYLWTGYGLRLGATIAFEFGPDPECLWTTAFSLEPLRPVSIAVLIHGLPPALPARCRSRR